MTNPMAKHEGFLLNSLLPLVAGHARRVGCPGEEAAMACFLALGTVLHSAGLTEEDLMKAIRASSRRPTHSAPWRIQ